MKMIKYMMKMIFKCPLLFLLVISWAGVTGYAIGEGDLDYALEHDIVQNPVFTALLAPEEMDSQDLTLTAAGDGGEMDFTNEGRPGDAVDKAEDSGGNAHSGDVYFEPPGSSDGPDGSNAQPDGSDEQQSADGWTAVGDAGNPKEEESDDGPEPGVTRFKKKKKQRTDSPYYSDPGKIALTTDFDYQEVDKSYFDDAVFIGDSRTVGMQDYSGLDNATFFAKTGLNVYKVLDDAFIEDPKTGKDVTVSYMMKHYKYGKIYFMIGINELGTGNTGTFQSAYAHVLEKLRQWQPDAVIYIQGIIAVSAAKSSEDAVFNNININDKNVAIAQLADGKDIFYLDVNPKLTDKDGNLKADYTFDEIHMYAKYYQIWTKFLTKHAVVR